MAKKGKMTRVYVSYRGEFGAKVKVGAGLNTMAQVEEAIRKFERGDCKIACIGDLHNEYFQVSSDKTDEVLKEEGQ